MPCLLDLTVYISYTINSFKNLTLYRDLSFLSFFLSFYFFQKIALSANLLEILKLIHKFTHITAIHVKIVNSSLDIKRLCCL